LSILGQVLYNIEISRYTLYTGEPIFTGKFPHASRSHVLGDFVILFSISGRSFPYLASSAATPLVTLFLPRGKFPLREEHGTILLDGNPDLF